MEELVAKRVEEELEKRRDEIEAEVLRRVEEAKRLMEQQMLEELEEKKRQQEEEQKKREVRYFLAWILHLQTYECHERFFSSLLKKKMQSFQFYGKPL